MKQIHLSVSNYIRTSKEFCTTAGGHLPEEFEDIKCLIYKEGFHGYRFLIGDFECLTHRDVKEKYSKLSTYSDAKLEGVVLGYKNGVFTIKTEGGDFSTAKPDEVVEILNNMYPEQNFETVAL